MIKMLYDEELKNKKYLFIGLAIAVIIAIVIAVFITIYIQNTKEKFTTITATNNKVSIEIPNNIKYRINSNKSNEFIIDLFSPNDEMYMYATSISKTRELDLLEVAKDDKVSYFKDKENIRDDSGFIKTTISQNNAVQYSLVYYSSEFEKDFYCDVLWVETDDALYIFNFEVANKNAEKYKDIFNYMKNSIVFY